MCGIVEHLARNLEVPVSVKIRLLDAEDPKPTCVLARRLVAAGASLLTLHGRTKEMRGRAVAAADWPAIATVFADLNGVVPGGAGPFSRASVGPVLDGRRGTVFTPSNK